LAFFLAQPNISATSGSDEVTLGSADAAGEIIRSSALTQAVPEPKAISSRSPVFSWTRLMVYRAYARRSGRVIVSTVSPLRRTVYVPPVPALPIHAEKS
jgi:hypothetical protein